MAQVTQSLFVSGDPLTFKNPGKVLGGVYSRTDAMRESFVEASIRRTPEPSSIKAVSLSPCISEGSESSDSEHDEKINDERVLQGCFSVKNYAFYHFTNTALYFQGYDITDETVFCDIELTDPDLDKPGHFRSNSYDERLEIQTQCKISSLPLSLLKEALNGTPIQIKWEWRTLNLTFVESGGMPKSQIINQLAKEILSSEICEQEDAEFILQNTYIPKIF